MWHFGDTIPIVLERAKTVPSHGVRCLSTVQKRVANTETENQMILAENDLRFLLFKTPLR